MIEKFDFNDILIEPETLTDIKSRSLINPFVAHNDSPFGYIELPIFVAPMDTVVDDKNINKFLLNNLNVCYPRTKNPYIKKEGNFFTSYSLVEIQHKLNGAPSNYEKLPYNILIDIANGHMSELLDTVKELKEKISCNLMVGNIANPKTYKALSDAGADYIRCGIGFGAGCFVETTQVITNEGYKNIEDIIIGDEVLTHKGNYEKVYNTISYKTEEDLINIDGTISTKDHKYYVLKNKYIDIVNDDNIHEYAEWVEAYKLDNTYFLLEHVINV